MSFSKTTSLKLVYLRRAPKTSDFLENHVGGRAVEEKLKPMRSEVLLVLWFGFPIPTGLNPSALGCEKRATQGDCNENRNPERVESACLSRWDTTLSGEWHLLK
jgi:hypothetical protein